MNLVHDSCPAVAFRDFVVDALGFDCERCGWPLDHGEACWYVTCRCDPDFVVAAGCSKACVLALVGGRAEVFA